MSRIENALETMGLSLPDVATPVGAYVPALTSEQLVYTSGQLPLVNGKLESGGKVGADVTVAQGYELARVCLINALAAIKAQTGELDAVERIIKVTGFVNATPEFTEHAKVINGASELLAELFGQAGQHVRSAVGVASLPLGAPVELEVTALIRRMV